MSKRTILFVCTGNTCRSPMAVALFQQMLTKEKFKDVLLWSRGVSVFATEPLSEGAREALAKAGLKGIAHESKSLAPEDVDQADRIFAMTQGHIDILLKRYPAAKPKIRLLGESDIVDPIGGSPSDYEKCRIEIQNALLDLLTDLKSEGSSKP